VVAVAKPAGPTSHDVVDAARKALGERRVGHLGTLDPFASGVLVLVVGRATRLARFAAEWPKTYDGVIRLGRTTATDDPTGAVVATSEAWRGLEEAAVRGALERFLGGYAQRPPAFSAVKVGGERAYRAARRGAAVTLEPRPVEIRELVLAGFEPPDVRFRAVVGGGTYLRSLARDVGETLGSGAHLAELVRTAVGPFVLADAVAPEAIAADRLRDAAALVAHLPRRDLSGAEGAAVRHGRPIGALGGESGPVALYEGETLRGVAEPVGAELRPRVVLVGA
jgi:tRNA pseudouridine55 synthase